MSRGNFAGLALLVLSAPLFAHHGTAASYDQDKTVKVKGIVKEFLWRNPHSALFMDGKDEAGKPISYSIEMGSPNTLAKMGFTRTIFKPGDEVVIEMNPSFTNRGSGQSRSDRPVWINGKPLRGGDGTAKQQDSYGK